MKEEITNSSELRKEIRILSGFSLALLVVELPTAHPRAIEEVLQKKAKDFGKNPKFLIELIKTAENFPQLKSAIDNTHLIETPSLDIPAVEEELKNETSEIFRELKNVVAHRARLALKKPRNVSDDSPVAAVVRINPTKHEKDSIEDLIKYLINNPESGFHFLRQKTRQQELAKNPILIARMIAGDSNLRKTIQKEKTIYLTDIPAPIQQALSAFSESVILLSTPQLKSNVAAHPTFMQEVRSIAETSSDDVFPEKEIYALNRRVKETVIHDIELMLAKLPHNETKNTLQKRFYALQKAQDISQLKTDPHGLQLHEEAKDAVTKFDTLIKIRSLLQDPLLQQSEQFNQLRLELERLNENSSLSEITRHNTALAEIKAKNKCLYDMYALVHEIKEKETELAEKFHRLASDFNERSQQKPMNEFIEKLKAVRNNINSLVKAHTALKDLLLKESPALDSLKNQLNELNVDSKPYEFENFNKALKEARKIATTSLSNKEKTQEVRAASKTSHSYSQTKRSSSMEKLPPAAEESEESSSTTSYSESIEVYKSTPPKYRKPPSSPGQSHH